MNNGNKQIVTKVSQTVKNKMHNFKMDGKKVWNFAVEAFSDAVIKGLEKCKLTVPDVNFIVCHQANAVLIKTCMDKLKIPMEKTYLTVGKYGNTSGASGLCSGLRH